MCDHDEAPHAGDNDPTFTPSLGDLSSKGITPLPGGPVTPDPMRSCQRLAPISGRYEGDAADGRSALVLRVDIDARRSTSPVTGRVSGDLYKMYRLGLPGMSPKAFRVYSGSWIVDKPVVTWAGCSVNIQGKIRFWKGSHPDTTLKVHIPWTSGGPIGPAQVLISNSSGSTGFTCPHTSLCFRDVTLEVDVCNSVNMPPTLPVYDTLSHPDHPAGLPGRRLTIPTAYDDIGVCVTIKDSARTVIDDSAPSFSSWSPGELHDAMETAFSEIGSSWPRWSLWGMLSGQFDNPGVAGVMFDAAALYGGAGEAPDRQGFAVFRKHSWFAQLPSGVPANAAQAAAARDFLYTWVHEAGHAFNLLHSWDKSRPSALSWMNYPWKYDLIHGASSFWNAFSFQLDTEELIHVRHGDRASVIMGGDPWASGGHAEDGLLDLGNVEGDAPLEVVLRSPSEFDRFEEVRVEVVVRNLLQDTAFAVDGAISPERGNIVFFVQQPDGRIVRHLPLYCALATPELVTLEPARFHADRAEVRAEVSLAFGAQGFNFAEPGEYGIRAVYLGAGGITLPSRVHRIRVRRSASHDDERFADDYFTREVGLVMGLGGSAAPRLIKGVEVLAELAQRYPDTLTGARAFERLATIEARSFHRVVRRTMVQTKASDPERALDLNEGALRVYAASEHPSLQTAHRRVAVEQANLLLSMDRPEEARSELIKASASLKAHGATTVTLGALDAQLRSIQ